MSRFLKIIRTILPILTILGVLLMNTEFTKHYSIQYLMIVIGVFYIFDAIDIYKQTKNG